ncbi:MAG TPA: hypothetical protein VHL34_19220 [Rhizomicrobium sp.]|jgi:hypothetical protein|nr:hypothetical protein [Rhizomicrobium sp.]
MTDPRLAAALQNNIDWCDAVVRTHDGQTALAETHWSNTVLSPPFYPNLITRTPDHTAAQTAAVKALHDTGLEEGWGVKDAFATLDLAPLGLEILFSAQWLWRAPDKPAPSANVPGIDWKSVTNQPRLTAWERGFADGGEPLCIFKAPLLSDPNIAFLGGFNRDKVRAGAIFNRHAGVCGISNVFAPNQTATACLKAIVARAIAFAGDLPLVTYMADDAVSDWTALGFEPLGPLRVWVA